MLNGIFAVGAKCANALAAHATLYHAVATSSAAQLQTGAQTRGKCRVHRGTPDIRTRVLSSFVEDGIAVSPSRRSQREHTIDADVKKKCRWDVAIRENWDAGHTGTSTSFHWGRPARLVFEASILCSLISKKGQTCCKPQFQQKKAWSLTNHGNSKPTINGFENKFSRQKRSGDWTISCPLLKTSRKNRKLHWDQLDLVTLLPRCSGPRSWQGGGRGLECWPFLVPVHHAGVVDFPRRGDGRCGRGHT